VLYDFETTQDTKFSENATDHIDFSVFSGLVQFVKCKMILDCGCCGRRHRSFYDDTVGDLLSYFCKPRPWCNKVAAIPHNAKAFDSQFILKRAILLKWNRQLNLSGLKIISMKMQNIHFLGSVSYLPMPLRKFPETFGLASLKSWFPHYHNTKANLDYVGPIPTLSISALMKWVEKGFHVLV
jgi:hypothetical protein